MTTHNPSLTAYRKWRTILLKEAKRAGHNLKLTSHEFIAYGCCEADEKGSWECEYCGQKVELLADCDGRYKVTPQGGLYLKCLGVKP